MIVRVLAFALVLTGCVRVDMSEEPSVQPSVEQPPSVRSGPPWRPPGQTPWQWQLTGELDLSVDVPVYDVDGFETSAQQVAELHRRGRRVICYLNVGAAEDFRPDHGGFPERLLGRSNGWPGERWLDIRARSVLEPVLARRFDLCASKGFDAVEPDNLDGFLNDTGFDLSGTDQLAFNRMIARMAHQRGLAVALKNDAAQAAVLEPAFDFAIVEECVRFHECAAYLPFRRAGKPVLAVEYDGDLEELCAAARQLGLSAMRKPRDLGAAREPCPA